MTCGLVPTIGVAGTSRGVALGTDGPLIRADAAGRSRSGSRRVGVTRDGRGTAMRPRLLLGVVFGVLTMAAGLLGTSGGRPHALIDQASMSPARLH